MFYAHYVVYCRDLRLDDAIRLVPSMAFSIFATILANNLTFSCLSLRLPTHFVSCSSSLVAFDFVMFDIVSRFERQNKFKHNQ
jgi:hypothetical protein